MLVHACNKIIHKCITKVENVESETSVMRVGHGRDLLVWRCSSAVSAMPDQLGADWSFTTLSSSLFHLLLLSLLIAISYIHN